MTIRTLIGSLAGTVLMIAGMAGAQPPDNPVVDMTVTLPGGQTQEVSARESGVARITLPDGAEFGVRPTILDPKPWHRVVVTFFRMPTSSSASQEIGAVEVRTGGPAVDAKTSPDFKVAVTSVSEPPPANS